VASLLGGWSRWLLPVAVLVAGCSTGLVLPIPTPGPTVKLPYTAAPPTPTLSPLSTAAGHLHGAPYTPDDIAAALANVPSAFARELRTPDWTRAISDALSVGIWSYDGRPYRELRLQASCDEGSGLLRCDLSASGLPAFAPTRDYKDWYWFEIRNGFVRTTSTPDLRGYPPELQAPLDKIARAQDTDGRLKGLSLLSMAWKLAPPDDGYVLRYSDGNEELGTTLFVTIDRTTGRVLSIAPPA